MCEGSPRVRHPLEKGLMRPTFSMSVLVFFALAAVGLPLEASGLETWIARNGPVVRQTRLTPEHLRGVVYGAGRYVVWSDQGGVWSSADRCSWQAASGPSDVLSVAYGNGLFVAVGQNPVVWVSSDGMAWERRDSTPMAWASRVVHGEGGFVAHGATTQGAIGLFQSMGGVGWTLRRNLSWASTLAYGDGRYVALAVTPSTSPTTSVLVGQTLDPSIAWSSRTIDQALDLPGLTFGNGRYVAVGCHRDTLEIRVAVSTDTQTWTVTGVPGFESACLRGIAFADGQFVAVGDNGLILVSSDGMAWTEGPGPLVDGLSAVTWGADGWVVVGNNGLAVAMDLSVGVPSMNRHLHGAVHAEGRFVAVGEGGTVGLSANGQDWTVHSAGESKALLGVTHGATGYVAVGEQGTVITSTVGASWEPRASGTEAWLSAVAYGAGQYVAVGNDGVILGSPDGVSWEPRISGTTHWLKDVVHAAARFVAVGGRSLLSSVDGIQWVPHAGLRDLEAVAYGNGLWVAVGGTEEVRKDSGSGMGVAYTSRDGETWQRHKLSSLPWLRDVTYVSGWFVAVAGGDIGGVLRSVDGVRWEVLPVGEVQGLNALCSDGESVVAMGDTGTIVQSGFIEAPDADAAAYDPLDHWQARNPYPTGQDLGRCAYGNGRFVALGNRSENEHGVLLNRESSILASLDGVHWDRVFWDYGPVELFGLVYGQGQFVVVGEQGLILASDDGCAWREIDSGVEETLTDVAYGDGRFVVVSREGSVLSLVDGSVWARGELGAAGWLPWVRFGGGLFLAGLDSPSGLMASADGVSWSQTAINGSFWDIAFGPDGFRALGRRDPEGAWGLWRSCDGTDWTKIAVAGGLDTSWSRIWHCGGLYFASGGWWDGEAFVSRDGEHWERIDRKTLPSFNDVAFGAGHYVAVGWRGRVSRSRDGAVWTCQSLGPDYALDNIAFGDGVIVALQEAGPGALRSADGGLTWTETLVCDSWQNGDVAFGSGRFVAVSGRLESALGEIAVSEPDGGWTILEGLFPPLAGVAYGAGCFVALEDPGEYGDPGAYVRSLLTSSDGLEWESHPSGLEAEPTAVGFGWPGFVVLGSGGWIGLSPEGENWTWTQQAGLADGRLRAVAWGNDRYVAVAERTILVSTDGQTWERYRSDAFGTLFDVAYGGGRFVAAGGCGTVVSSVDGRTWRLHDAGMGFQLRGAAFDGAGFVLTGGTSPGLFIYRDRGSGLLLQSDPVQPAAPVVRMLDARREVARGEPFTLAVAVLGSPPLSYQWFRGQAPVAGATGRQFAVIAAGLHDAGSYFLEVSNAVGSARAGPVEVRVSGPPEVELRLVDGLGARVAPATLAVEAVVGDPDGEVVAVEFYLNEELVGTDTTAPFAWESNKLQPGVYQWRARAIDEAGLSAWSELATVRVISPDPSRNWSVESNGFAGGIGWIAYSRGEYFVWTPWGKVGFSSDLSSWEIAPLSADQGVQVVLYGDGWYVALASSNNSHSLWRSRDGRAWERIPAAFLPANSGMSAGAYGGGRFIMVGQGWDPEVGRVLYSSGPDATGWAVVSLPTLKGLGAVAYGTDRFVAVGREGAIVWSVDGAQWQAGSSSTTINLRDIAYGNGRFVAVGEFGTILTSDDGQAWRAVESGTTAALNAVAYGGQAFAAVGENGTILTSLDGFHWETCWGGGQHFWETIAWAQGRFVAMGPSGLMVRTDATTLLDPLRLTPDGRLVCGFVGVAGRNYQLERSEDLHDWTAAAAAAGVHGPMELVDPALPTGPYRFYRVLWTP
jgi:hypothetical protein